MPPERNTPARRWMVTMNPASLVRTCAELGLTAEELTDDLDYGPLWSCIAGRLRDPAGLLRRGRAADVTFFGGQFERGHGGGDEVPGGEGAGDAGAGQLHLQGYVHLGRPVRRSYFKDILPGAHLERAQGSPQQCWDYCRKDDTRVAGPFQVGEIQGCGQGARTDVHAAVEAIKGGAQPVGYVAANPEALRLQAHLRWFAQAYAKPRTEPPTVYWCWGPTGSGKSRWAAEFTEGQSTYWKPPDSKWWPAYAQQEAVIIDDFRPESGISFQSLLRLLDRYPLQVEPKGGYIHFNSPLIIITTPLNPQETFAAHTHEDIAQLERRITRVLQFPQE